MKTLWKAQPLCLSGVYRIERQGDVMGNLHQLLQWWNLLFTLPLVVGVLFSLVAALGFLASEHAGGEKSEVGQDVAAEAEHGDVEHGDLEQDGDIHSDLDHSADLSAGHGDVEHSLPAEVEHGEVSHEAHDAEHGQHNHHESVFSQILEAFGIGRGVPISVMLPFCMMLWGVLGLASNQALHPIMRFPAIYVWISALVSLVGTSLIARGVSGVVARYLQMGYTPSTSREWLIGATGIAVFVINGRGGVADVRDQAGTVHRITCCVREGNAAIPAGTPVVVTDYEEGTGRYFVEENPFADSISHSEVQA